MKHSNMTLDINILPKLVQVEILDFFEFLKQKYQVTNRDHYQTDNNQKTGFEVFLENKISVKSIQKFTREELNERNCFY
jgi:hypothetical protein